MNDSNYFDQLAFSKRLRRNQTEVEKRLWGLLRSKSLCGYKFRRQQVIGKYIADFCCLRKRLVIELDGGQHHKRIDYDQQRTQYLESQGFLTIRFWDSEVLNEANHVLKRILIALNDPHPFPLPRRERVKCINAYE